VTRLFFRWQIIDGRLEIIDINKYGEDEDETRDEGRRTKDEKTESR